MRNLKAPVLILLILILALAGKMVLPQFAQKKSPYEQVVATIDKDAISSVSITTKNESVALTRENDTWKISGKHADKDKVEDLIKQLTIHEGVQLIAQTEQRHKELGVATGQATEVKVGDISFYVATPSAAGALVRPANGDDVYLVPGISSFLLSTTSSYWIDMTLISYGIDQYNRIEFARTKERFTLVKQDEKWMIENGKEVKSEKWDPVAQKISYLVADGSLGEEKIREYPKLSSLTMTVSAGNEKETLTFFQGKDNYLVIRGSDGGYFVVNSDKAEALLLSQQDLL